MEMRKILILFLLLFVGCSNSTLTCCKSNYSIYGKETEYQIFEYQKENFINYSLVKKLKLNDDSIKYIDEINNQYLLEKVIIDESIKSSTTTVEKGSKTITIQTNININLTDETIIKLNLDKDLSLEYVKKNMTEKGYNCEYDE